MADLALLDQIMDIIRRVPHAHNQGDYIVPNDEEEAVERELAANPDLAAVVDCYTALCVGGWALHLRGYRGLSFSYGFTYPAGHRYAGCRVIDVGREAAGVLDLDPEDAGITGAYGLFFATNTLPDLEDWALHLHGKLAREDLLRRFAERRIRT